MNIHDYLLYFDTVKNCLSAEGFIFTTKEILSKF